MAKKPEKAEDVKDEPGAEQRFLRGIKRALDTPPKPFTPKKERPQRQDKDGQDG